MQALKQVIRMAAVTFLLAGTVSAIEGQLRPIHPIYDFGEVGIDFELNHIYKFVNVSNTTIRIDSAKVNCDCSRAYVLDEEAKPGDTASVLLQFNTKDWYGRVSKAIQIYTSELGDKPFEVFYLATVGQWFFNAKPDPINLFFLPAHKSRKVTIPNPAAEKLVFVSSFQQDTLYTVTPITKAAGKGKSIELEVSPRQTLKAGTYVSNFRLSFEVSGAKDTLHMSMPVKIVRY